MNDVQATEPDGRPSMAAADAVDTGATIAACERLLGRPVADYCRDLFESLPQRTAETAGPDDVATLFRAVLLSRTSSAAELRPEPGWSTIVLADALATARRAGIASGDISVTCLTHRPPPEGTPPERERDDVPRLALRRASALCAVEVVTTLRRRDSGPMPLLFIDGEKEHPHPTLDLLGVLDAVGPGAAILFHRGDRAGGGSGIEHLVAGLSAWCAPPWDGAMAGTAWFLLPNAHEELRDELLRVLYDHAWETTVDPSKLSEAFGATTAADAIGQFRDQYQGLIAQVHHLVQRATPPDAVVAVASRGDDRIIDFRQRVGWHFPRRSDGVYAGHHPVDSTAAVQHLVTLQGRGANFFLLPSTSSWWLDHYTGFKEYFDEHCTTLLDHEVVGRLYALFRPGRDAATTSLTIEASATVPAAPAAAPRTGSRQNTQGVLRSLFDTDFYARQVDVNFKDSDAAMAHYVSAGAERGLDPNVLFDTSYYLSRYPSARRPGVNPLLHYVEHSVTAGHNPGPYFDTNYYYSQDPGLRAAGVNSLAHYLEYGSRGEGHDPNPLFSNAYYVASVPAVKANGLAPLAHYLASGAAGDRSVSRVHRSLIESLHRSGRSSLVRGAWVEASALLFADGVATSALPALADEFAEHHRVDSSLVVLRAPDAPRGRMQLARSVVLEDYQVACDVLRPSALRLLTRSLCAGVDLAVTEIPDVVQAMHDAGTVCFFAPNETLVATPEMLDEATRLADLVLVGSDGSLRSFCDRLGRVPSNAVVVDGPTARGAPASELLQIARTATLGASAAVPSRRSGRLLTIPCSDWSVSGVNSSLESVGMQLGASGWDVEILFTRHREHIVSSAGGEGNLPRVAYRFLKRTRSGVAAMWEALISDLQRNAPQVVLLGYDFLANSVAPALTDDLAVVAWVQSDDGDYYEQVYRLGRYCNAVVSVSDTIRSNIDALNPRIGERTRVIHNSSVSEADISSRKRQARDSIRIAYCGRLVQYQKRVLDYVALARALDAIGAPYAITLIGEFDPRDEATGALPVLARDLIADGRLALAGRLNRYEILRRLTGEDFFVLLSDFEGLPLSLVEAMAKGCVPVVAAMDSGIPELVKDGDNGLVLETRDYRAWAEAIARVWEDRTRYAQLSRRARATVREGFTIERIAHEFGELLTEVAAQAANRTFSRPPALHWGHSRTSFGDVLPPPSMHHAFDVPGL